LNGTLNLHIELEAKVAAFVKKEGVLTYSAGFQTNLGIISALAGRNDYIIADRQNHASLVDACRLSFARLLKYRHNDMEDLEKVLSNVPDNKGKLIVVDGVFSMEGDIANLPEIVRLAKEYGARIMVDDSHGLGVMGEHGRGTAEYFDLEAEVDIVMATFSKSLGSIGGFVAAKEPVIHYIKHHSRPFIFSASISPANAAAAIKALSILEQEPERVRNLWENARFLRSTLEDMGVRIGSTQTPITPILIGNDYQTFALTKALLDEGVYVNPVVSPAVEEGHSLIRAVCTSTHTKEQLEYALRAFEKVFKTIRSHNLITAN
ncbi:MAG: aminotransferase class I/II-fold pyridoxal phosphate-dependent enzyme, partial [Bacillota bacterium]|nr:aminotransferase class I/II-fold pyridoxal phosphate-dependent enzyme [Bacillota bacterium]